MKGTWTWVLELYEKGTHLTTRIVYKVAGGIIGKAMDTLLIEQANEKNIEQLLKNLKKVSEA